ncbi:MAG: hypothetical protein K5846_09915 [Bacteroidales bacterium]|nr:hypothetical protein [Bacteroidales bacterium]
MSQANFFKFAIVLLGSVLMTSCIAYRPQVAEMPLIHEKGELQMNGSVGLSAPFGDAYVGTTASYGATDWLAVQAHANWNGYKGGYGHAAVGAFKAWNRAVLEGFIGYGFGGNKWENENTGREFTSRYHLPFAQLEFGWAGIAKGHIDIGVGVKGGCLFPNLVDWKPATEDHPESIVRSTEPVALLEPQFFFRAGGKHLKWTLNLGYAQLWGTAPDKEVFAGINAIYMPFTINMGITYDFNVFTRKGER